MKDARGLSRGKERPIAANYGGSRACGSSLRDMGVGLRADSENDMYDDGGAAAAAAAAAALAAANTAAQAAWSVAAISEVFTEIPMECTMTLALARAVVAAARRTIQTVEACSRSEALVKEACKRCSEALKQPPHAAFGDLSSVAYELDTIVSIASGPPTKLIHQARTMIEEVLRCDGSAAAPTRLFSCLFQAACNGLHQLRADVGQGAAPNEFAHCFTLLATAEKASPWDVEGVARLADALQLLQEAIPAERDKVRAASIIPEDLVVLRCCCAVGHGCRARFLDRLVQAFSRPLGKLQERLLNSFRKNFFNLDGAFPSNTQVQRRHRAKNKNKTKRGAPHANQPSCDLDEQPAEDKQFPTQSCSTSDTHIAEEGASETCPSTSEASIALFADPEMPYPLRVQVEALLKVVADEGTLPENRIQCAQVVEKLLVDHAQEPFGPNLVGAASASLSSVLSAIDGDIADGIRGAVARAILVGGWRAELFNEALDRVEHAVSLPLTMLTFASESDEQNPMLEASQAIFDEIAGCVPSLPNEDLSQGIASWVQKDAWRKDIENRKSLLWRRFTFVGLLFGVETAICDILQTTKEECILETGYNSLTSVLQAKLSTSRSVGTEVARVVDLILDARPQLERTMAAGMRTLALLMRGAAASAERGGEDAWPAKVVFSASVRAVSLAQKCGALEVDVALSYGFAPLLNDCLMALQSIFEGALAPWSLPGMARVEGYVRGLVAQVLQDYALPQPPFLTGSPAAPPGTPAAQHLQDSYEANEEGRRSALRYANKLLEEHRLGCHRAAQVVDM
mmetsp:Transcript_50786/g.128044  ORF Transcript_50786/g.128044 Transcript_50786/m.128044 type:complete len:800 (-) Transcript_50786:135-2534(-)